MIAERHNAPQHNLHANQAGNAGDSTCSAQSSLPWRRLGRFFAATVLTGFVLNEIWEMAQMSAYVETAGRSWTSTLGLCTKAAVGDVGIILGIYAAGALAAGDLGWLARPLEPLRHGGYSGACLCGVGGARCAGRRTLVVHGAHAGGVRALRGVVAATSNDTAAFGRFLDLQVVVGS